MCPQSMFVMVIGGSGEVRASASEKGYYRKNRYVCHFWESKLENPDGRFDF